MPDYTRENYLKLRELVNSGQLDETRLRKAQNYMRQYLSLNPQDAPSDLETVQRAQGKPVAAPQGPNTQALDFQTPQPSAAEQFGTGRTPTGPEYPPEYAQNIQREAALHPSTGGPTPREQQQEQLRQAAQQFDTQAYDTFAQQKDEALPSESGVKGFYRPPEYVAPKRTAFGMEANAPIYYSDPGLDEFKREMQPMFAGGSDAFTDGSTAFKVWKDAKWANAYDRAKEMGRGIVRIDHARGTKWEKVAQKVSGMVDAAVPSALQSMTLGTIDLLDPTGAKVSRLQQEAQPGAATAGGVVGTFAPGSLAEAGFSGVAKGISAIPGVRKLETSALGRLGMSALKGGAGAAVVGGAEDATRALASAIAEKDPRELVPNLDTAKRAGERALVGGGIGGTAELLGIGAQRATENLRNPEKFRAGGGDVARDVNRIDAAGASLGLGGVKPSSAMARQIEAGRVANARPEEVAADELVPSLVQAAGKKQEAVIRLAGQRKQKAIAAIESAGNPKAVPWDAIDAALARAKKGLDEEGNPLPAISVKAEQRFLNEALAGQPRVMPRFAAEKYVARNPDAKIYEPEDLRAAGLKTAQDLQPDDVMVVRAKSIGARKASEWYDMLQEAQGGPPADAAQYRKNLSIREPTGALRSFIAKKFTALSDALNASHSELNAMEAEHAASGLPKQLRIERQTVKSKVGRSPDSPQVLREELPRFGMDKSTAEAFARMAESDLKKPVPEPKYRTISRAQLNPFGELPKLRGTLLGAKEPKTESALADLASSAKELPAYRALEGLLASRRLSGATEVHPYVTAGMHGPRVGGIGKWTAIRLRTDNVMKTLARLPPEDQGSLVDLAKSIHQGLKDKFGPGLKELDRLAEQHTAEIERLSAPGYVRSETQAAAEAGTVAPGRAKATDETTVAGVRTPDQVRAERDASINKLRAEVARLTKEYVRRSAKTQRPLNTSPVRSIRGGRPGRAAAAIGQSKPSDLTPEEMRLLMLILEAQPEEKKPKEVAAK